MEDVPRLLTFVILCKKIDLCSPYLSKRPSLDKVSSCFLFRQKCYTYTPKMLQKSSSAPPRLRFTNPLTVHSEKLCISNKLLNLNCYGSRGRREQGGPKETRLCHQYPQDFAEVVLWNIIVVLYFCVRIILLLCRDEVFGPPVGHHVPQRATSNQRLAVTMDSNLKPSGSASNLQAAAHQGGTPRRSKGDPGREVSGHKKTPGHRSNPSMLDALSEADGATCQCLLPNVLAGCPLFRPTSRSGGAVQLPATGQPDRHGIRSRGPSRHGEKIMPRPGPLDLPGMGGG